MGERSPICRCSLEDLVFEALPVLRKSAHWASWADCLGMIHQRHPDVANRLVAQLEGHPDTPLSTCGGDSSVVHHRSPHDWCSNPTHGLALAGGVRPAQIPATRCSSQEQCSSSAVFTSLLPWTQHSCRCGLPLDSRGHHRAACAWAGVLERSGLCPREPGSPHLPGSRRQGVNQCDGARFGRGSVRW